MLQSVQIVKTIEERSINKYLALCLALFVVPISGLAIDIYVPSLPAITSYFGVDKSLAQLTITFYMAGLGLMQLFAGVISDSFGRKKPFLIAMALFILATFLIPLSASIQQLLLLRLVQGSAVAMVIVPMRSVLNDLFEGPEYYKKSNYMFLAWSMGPIVAPMIGGYLQHYFGWQSSFYFLLMYSVIFFILIFFLMPETSQHRHPFRLATSLCRYKQMLLHKEYITGVLMNCLLYSLIILFAVVGPFLIENKLHYSPIEFGRVSLLAGLAWFLGGFTNRFLIHIALKKKAVAVFSAMLFISVVTLVLGFIMPMSISLIVLPTLLMLYLGGIVFPNNFARGIAFFPKTTGSANALFGSLVFLGAGISSGLATFLKSGTQIPLGIAYVGIIFMCLIVTFIQNQKREETL